MTEQAENELICEKLLGWQRISRSPDDGSAVWDSSYSTKITPTFTTWAEAGMILDWLMSHVGPGCTTFRDSLAFEIRQRTLTPYFIRAAALAYLRAQP